MKMDLLLMKSLGIVSWQSVLIINLETGSHPNCLLLQVLYPTAAWIMLLL